MALLVPRRLGLFPATPAGPPSFPEEIICAFKDLGLVPTVPAQTSFPERARRARRALDNTYRGLARSYGVNM